MKKEIFSKFYTKFRLYIFPSVVALSSLILIIFVIYPQLVKLIDNQKVQGDLLKKSKFLEAKASVLENLDEKDLETKLGYVLNAYPSEPDFVNVLAILQAISNQNGFTITTLSVNPGAGSSGIQKYTIKLDAVGGRSLLPRFITSIESSKRVMKLGSVEISPGRDAASVSVSLGVEVLYAQEPSSFGGVDSPLPEISQKDEALISTLASFNNSNPTIPSQTAGSFSPRGKADPFQ